MTDIRKKHLLFATLVIALPVAGQRLIDIAVNMADTIMLGYYGDVPLSASSLANQFYKVPLDETDKSLLVKNFKNNKDFLSAMSMEKSDFNIELMQAVEKCLSYKARS